MKKMKKKMKKIHLIEEEEKIWIIHIMLIKKEQREVKVRIKEIVLMLN